MMVRVSETYDLSTIPDKMSLIGIHTPSLGLFNKMWSGLARNHKFMRFVGCDVVMACASALPADPLQIGVEAGSIAPQDMFNPILYTACSNDSYNTLLSRIMSPSQGSAHGPSVSAENEPPMPDGITDWEVYYGLLANPDGFRRALPQQGLEMRGLFPVVYQVLSNVGMVQEINGSESNVLGIVGAQIPTGDPDSGVVHNEVTGRSMRGPAMRMPMFPTVVSPTSDGDLGGITVGTLPTSADAPANDEPARCYVGAIIMPPCKLNRLYYRMKVTWTIELIGPRPLTDVGPYSLLQSVGNQSYSSDYTVQSQAMTNKLDMVDTLSADIQKIMEGGK